MQPIDAPPAPATVVVVVTDVNDNSPTFLIDLYAGVVPEDAAVGHIVLASVAAFDRDQVKCRSQCCSVLSAYIIVLQLLHRVPMGSLSSKSETVPSLLGMPSTSITTLE